MNTSEEDEMSEEQVEEQTTEPAAKDWYAKDEAESDIEFEDSPGVPGQIQYPADSSMSQYAAEEESE
jgi:hypothetical protein